jgi:uncharacterized protein YcaQ
MGADVTARLRAFAVRRTFGAPTTLAKAIDRLGFVQMDPIRAPARAQDLILRQRVRGYRAGALEARWARLGVEEDFFVNYGTVTRALHALMHPRTDHAPSTRAEAARAEALVAFVRAHGVVHPRDADAHFAHGRATNWFGGNSRVTTQLLDRLHYRGVLRVAGREGGTRTYAVREPTPPHPEPDAALDALVDVLVAQYAPLPATTLAWFVNRLQHAAPQWAAGRRAALARAKARLAQVVHDGTTWYWPADERLPARTAAVPEVVRLLAPFDPLAWDRVRFARLFGWEYRFEAYVPAPKRVRGYYALPVLWRDAMPGWANVAVRDGVLAPDLGWVAGTPPRDRAFRAALEAELAAFAAFLGASSPGADRTGAR